MYHREVYRFKGAIKSRSNTSFKELRTSTTRVSCTTEVLWWKLYKSILHWKKWWFILFNQYIRKWDAYLMKVFLPLCYHAAMVLTVFVFKLHWTFFHHPDVNAGECKHTIEGFMLINFLGDKFIHSCIHIKGTSLSHVFSHIHMSVSFDILPIWWYKVIMSTSAFS